jgi:hypothetical protein
VIDDELQMLNRSEDCLRFENCKVAIIFKLKRYGVVAMGFFSIETDDDTAKPGQAWKDGMDGFLEHLAAVVDGHE